MKVYLIRHGESLSNASNTVASPKTPLTEDGIIQVKLLRDTLFKNITFTAIYTSPLERTKQTAHVICKSELDILETSLLSEKKDPTSFESLRKEDLPWEIIKKERLNPDWKLEDGESFNDIKFRVIKIMQELQKYPTDANILLVTHNSFIKFITLYILLEDALFNPKNYYHFADRLETKNTGVTLLEYKKKYYESTPSWYVLSWMI